MTRTGGKKYTRDVIVRITGDDRSNVYWEATLIENKIKPELPGNTFAFTPVTDAELEITKEVTWNEPV